MLPEDHLMIETCSSVLMLTFRNFKLIYMCTLVGVLINPYPANVENMVSS